MVPNNKIAKTALSIRASLLRRIVSRFRMDIERRQTFRGSEFNLELSPLPVTGLVTWTVSEHILVAQLYSNLNGGVSQVIDVIDRESASAGHVSDLTQEIGAAYLFG